MNKLELIVFNVGHGLSVALIERPENYVTLIDLGAETGFTPLKHLRLQDKLTVDVLYITHPHADHLDDVETALEDSFRPLGIYYQDYDWKDVKKREKPELAYKIDDFQELIGLVPHRSYAGKADLTAWRYTPEKAKEYFGDESYINNSSLVIVYKWRDFKVTVAGDLESDAMEALIATNRFKDSAASTNILVPAHHGHKNGFPTGWVATLGKPHVSIISVQERDPHVDSRYNSSDFAKGVEFNGTPRYALTTRKDGNIRTTMYYGADNKPTWSFTAF